MTPIAELREFIAGVEDASEVRVGACDIVMLLSEIDRLTGERDAWKARSKEHHRSVDVMHQRAQAAEQRCADIIEQCAKVAEDVGLSWFNGEATTTYGKGYQNGCLSTASEIRALAQTGRG